MYPLSTPRLELYVAGLEMVNASSREHNCDSKSDSLQALAISPSPEEDDCCFGRPLASFPKENQRPKSSRRRLVCARLTGISVCFLSSMRS
jgi:hypothetical protein